MQPYWRNKHSLTIADNLLMFNDRLVIQRSLRLEVLSQLHHGHLGVTKCKARAADSVWWPLINDMIEEMVAKSQTCAKNRQERKEPLLPASLPNRPWERVASDLFEYNKKQYVLVVDYLSRWIEVRHLPKTTSEEVIKALKSIFAQHGIPDIMMSDNGPQYASEEFKLFTKMYGFMHATSSPRYPQANGEAERSVQTVKNILKKNDDPYLGLLAYRSTPLHNGLSPSQLLMGRHLRTTLPVPLKTLENPVDEAKKSLAKGREQEYRMKAAENYNRRHKTIALPTLEKGDTVWIKDQNKHGNIVSLATNPRSYNVVTETGSSIRRNRSALIHTGSNVDGENRDESLQESGTEPEAPKAGETPENHAPQAPCSDAQVTRSGRTIRAPKRMDL